MVAPDQHLHITPPARPLEDEVEDKLRKGLEACPDVAFAHLVDVDVPGLGEGPGTVLFVWLVPAAMKSLRAALNLVSESVAKALPRDRFLDVVILNSARGWEIRNPKFEIQNQVIGSLCPLLLFSSAPFQLCSPVEENVQTFNVQTF
jgi:hypothetical protein